MVPDKAFIVKGKRQEAPHSWISNGAFSLVKRVRDAEQSGERDGLTYLQMSALILIAFSNEAHLNLFGSHAFGDAWPESAKTIEKLELLSKHYDLNDQKFEDAKSAVKGLIKQRNRLAHPKYEDPKKFEKTFSTRPTDELLHSLQEPDFLKSFGSFEVERQFKAMETIYQSLRDASQLDEMEHGPWSTLSVSEKAKD